MNSETGVPLRAKVASPTRFRNFIRHSSLSLRPSPLPPLCVDREKRAIGQKSRARMKIQQRLRYVIQCSIVSLSVARIRHPRRFCRLSVRLSVIFVSSLLCVLRDYERTSERAREILGGGGGGSCVTPFDVFSERITFFACFTSKFRNFRISRNWDSFMLRVVADFPG